MDIIWATENQVETQRDFRARPRAIVRPDLFAATVIERLQLEAFIREAVDF